MTPADDVSAATGRLRLAGLSNDEASQSALVLARFALGWSAADWLSRSRDAAAPEFAERFSSLIDRRARHEPVAYITGEREFYGRPFKVTPAVLIPRPETEIVVDEAIAAAGPRRTSGSLRILDVGTGSGCLAVTLALECPAAAIVATDVSRAALDVALDNARRLGAGSRIDFRAVDGSCGAFAASEPEGSRFDLVVANPPYVRESDRESLPEDVIGFEPAIALFAGTDGLSVIRQLLPMAADALVPGGHLVMEIGHGQLSEVQDLIQGTAGLTFHHFQPDLQGVSRVVVATAAGGAF
jgi:release factor glutamine methyltransferase